jgi:hypothetical protein
MGWRAGWRWAGGVDEWVSELAGGRAVGQGGCGVRCLRFPVAFLLKSGACATDDA